MKNCTRSPAILLAFLSVGINCLAQSTPVDNTAPPVVIPASPTAAALFHDIDVPIDYYTGGQKVGIPIHTVKLGSLQVPITLHYRANGIKVEEEAGWTGLEWDLDAAGAIGRSIIGWPDEDPSIGYRRTATYLGMPDPSDVSGTNAWFTALDTCSQYTLALGKTMELTPDSYFINLCGNSARLFFDKNGQYYISPYKPWKITGNETAGFTVVTEDGTTYVCQLAEATTNTVETLPGDDHSTPVNANTSWYLTQIISANKTDTINISYKQVGYNPIAYIPTESYSLPWSLNSSSTCGSSPQISHTYTYQTHSVGGYILSSISTRNQRVDFISNANRSDIPDSTKGEPYKLDSIMIYAISPGSADVLLKKFRFQYDYYNNADPTYVTKRLRLLSLTESDPASTMPQQYSFSYHDSTLPAKTSMAQDLWGYYNSKNANSTMIPTYTDPYGAVTTLADRSIDTTQASLGLLQTIKYPTGGTTSFEYESNRSGQADSIIVTPTANAHTGFVGFSDPYYASATLTIPWQQYVTVISEIKEPTGLIGESYVQIFPAGSTTPIFMDQTISNFHSSTIQLNPGTYTITATKDERTDMSAEITVQYQTHAPAPYVGDPIGGTRIKRMVQSDGYTNIVKRFTYLMNDSVASGNSLGNGIYSSMTYAPIICGNPGVGDGFGLEGYWTYYTQHSTSVTSLGSIRGGNIAYSKVTVLSGDNGENGREEYYYNFIPDVGGGGYPYAPNSSFDDVRGLLLKKMVYRNDNQLMEKDENAYDINDTYGNPNFKSIFGVKSGTLRTSNTYGSGGCPTGNGWDISSRLYQAYQFWPTMISSAKTTFSSTGNDSTTTITYMNYDTLNTQLIKSSLLTSKGDSLITYTKFPDSFSGTSVYDQMNSRNMIGLPIEQDEYRGTSLVSKKITNYSSFANNGNPMLLPSYIQLQNGNGPLETRLQLDNYDQRGNLVSQNKTGDIIHSYIYDYQTIYPIAEVTNSDSGSIAYTSFEADGTGNWVIGSGSRDSTTGITGTRSYALSGSISKTCLNSANTYIVSYWTTNTSYFNITGTISGYPVKGKTINGWTLYVHKVTGQTTVSISGSGHIDELRLYPAAAQMTTYTYQTLVGMTSQCDVGNRVTYYEYDGLQRLKRIRDQDYNILKTYDYQYQVSSGCGPNCYAITMQTLAGTNTLGYPVGVFDVHGKLLGNATGPVQYDSLWNADTADARIGVLSTGSDSLHFGLTLNSGMAMPSSVTGCRYYQYDLPWSRLDAVRNFNGVYVDFGDGTGMYLAKQAADTPAVIAPNTTYFASGYYDYYLAVGVPELYIVHNYPDSTLKTITFYHNDAAENSDFDNIYNPATSLVKLRNLRGNLPQNTNEIGGSSYQQASALSVAGISNWNNINSVQIFNLNNGDGANSVENLGYSQDFMKNNKGLLYLTTQGCADTSFRLSLLKSDWNTYFTNLFDLELGDNQWNREDISALTNLWFIKLNSTRSDGAGVIDNIINQIAAGAGRYRNNGIINISLPGFDRTASSADAYQFLKSRSWVIAINGVLE